MTAHCWFCQEPLNRRPVEAPTEAMDGHHIVCRRYFGPDDDRDFRNTAAAHTGCHRRFHRRYDDQRLSLGQYLERMDPIAVGRGIFAKEETAARDTDRPHHGAGPPDGPTTFGGSDERTLPALRQRQPDPRGPLYYLPRLRWEQMRGRVMARTRPPTLYATICPVCGNRYQF